MHRYLMNMAVCIKNIEDKSGWPFFNLNERLIIYSELNNEDKERLDNYLEELPYYIKPYILKWYVQCELSNNPYEYLIRIYETGGSWFTENGFICFSICSLPMGTCQDYYNLGVIKDE